MHIKSVNDTLFGLMDIFRKIVFVNMKVPKAVVVLSRNIQAFKDWRAAEEARATVRRSVKGKAHARGTSAKGTGPPVRPFFISLTSQLY